MYILFGIVYFVIGIFMIFLPQKVYDMRISRKNDTVARSPKLYVLFTVLGGIVFALGGVALFVSQFIV